MQVCALHPCSFNVMIHYGDMAKNKFLSSLNICLHVESFLLIDFKNKILIMLDNITEKLQRERGGTVGRVSDC